MSKPEFDYYYGAEAEQFSFLTAEKITAPVMSAAINNLLDKLDYIRLKSTNTPQIYQ